MSLLMCENTKQSSRSESSFAPETETLCFTSRFNQWRKEKVSSSLVVFNYGSSFSSHCGAQLSPIVALLFKLNVGFIAALVQIDMDSDSFGKTYSPTHAVYVWLHLVLMIQMVPYVNLCFVAGCHFWSHSNNVGYRFLEGSRLRMLAMVSTCEEFHGKHEDSFMLKTGKSSWFPFLSASPTSHTRR